MSFKIDEKKLRSLPTERLQFMVGIGDIGIREIWPKSATTEEIAGYLKIMKAELERRKALN